ncbi:EamA family transporter [Sporosarcina sp. P12(2017)]|uniref:DMT family transporter n=1 Tax=unclassified Sporosarcina TaxID=2647733 RepID=UPI000C16881F|nr:MULTISPECIES: DMT family transporter [unclassified Sporosarcina]PIC57557.1 EamA family transporter [Sporosarcina sp. P10]PIC60939.1 EamA family transporter [Sporosarcina sp. P12(2017)]
MRKYIGEIGLTITAIIWGSGFVMSALALEYYTPYQILAVRFTIGALLLSVVFHKRLLRVDKSVLWKGALLGVLLYAAFALQTVGLQFTTPSKNAFLTGVNVVMVPFIAFILYKRKLDTFELFGAVLALIGVAVLSLQWSTTINIGDMLTLGCAVMFAFHIFYTARFVRTEDAILLTLLQMAIAAVISCLTVIGMGETSFSMEPKGISSVLYLAVFSTTLAFLMQTVGQKHLSETKAAIILSTESVWGMIFSVALAYELLTFRMFLGALIIFIAILLSEVRPQLLKKRIPSQVKEHEI